MDVTLSYFVYTLCSALGGFFLLRLILKPISRLALKDALKQRKEILQLADLQVRSIKDTTLDQQQESQKLHQEDFEEELSQLKKEVEQSEEDLKSQTSILEQEEQRILKTEAIANQKEANVNLIDKKKEEKKQELEQMRISLYQNLEQTSRIKSEELTLKFQKKILEDRHIEYQKVLKLIQEEVSSTARKQAQRVLERSMSRYEPQFVWPKTNNFVEVSNKAVIEPVMADQCPLILSLREWSGVTIQGTQNLEHPETPAVVRLVGGFGIYKEAARLTLIELLNKGPDGWKQGEKIYKKHREAVEQEAKKLGKKAVNILKLKDIHPEIQMLVGALNWRTSYRQNQWYHTVEVATLAGVLAAELGVDPEAARRVGMLHDIGKAIDYRIEGSHAVISGDYADRFGESRIICDTVMSHHADLIVESALAYVLRAADTLSGARPGARVNLEEGYQIRISAIYEAVTSFPGVLDVAIMNGGREVHVHAHWKRVPEHKVKDLAHDIARKIEQDVAYPGQIKVVVTRFYESVAVA